jgi:phosphatidate cytidylyltransferase
MSFANPLLLLFFVPIAVAAWRLLRRGRRPGIRFSAVGRLPARAAGWRAQLAALTPFILLAGLSLLAIAAGVLIAFVGEMLRFKLPGGHLINLSGAVFAIVYVGLLGSFLVMLRIAYGVPAVVSMIVVAKLCDVGAYTVGRLIGRHKMAPSLSPGKTIEGAVGGIAFAIFGAWLSVAVLFPLATGEPSQTTWVGVVIYGLAVGLAGMLGDLAESLIKRDVMRKDSGTNVPGFGGFLDIYDSLLLAAPVAFGLWAFHVVQ